MDSLQYSLISILNYGLGTQNSCTLPHNLDWKELMVMSQQHGVDAIVLDGIERLAEEGRANIDLTTKLSWIGAVAQQEQIYIKKKRVLADLSKIYAKHGIRMMVLKGLGLSLNYPKPEHRICNDIDIYLFGEQKRADRILKNEYKIEIDNSEHQHSIFYFHGVMIENHYNFLNIYAHLSSRKIEKKLKVLSSAGLQGANIEGQTVYFPSADFNALFILRHTASHFAGSAMNIRQVIDWGLFVKKHHDEIDWNMLLPFIKDMNMDKFYDA